MLEQLPAASRVGKTIVGGIDLNKARMRRVTEALLALSSSPNGFTASEVAARVRALSKQNPLQYGPRHAAYDLKKLRGKHIIRQIDHTGHRSLHRDARENIYVVLILQGRRGCSSSCSRRELSPLPHQVFGTAQADVGLARHPDKQCRHPHR
jgi:hypothetical protein